MLTETDHDDRCLTSSMGFGDLYIPWYQIDLKVRAKSFGQENTVQFIALSIDDGAELSCSAQNAAVDQPIESRTVKLNVLSK